MPRWKVLIRSGNSAIVTDMEPVQVPAGVVRTTQFRMAERLAGGDLALKLAELFDQSHSWEQVARDLYATYGISITGQTLRRWAEQLGIGAAA